MNKDKKIMLTTAFVSALCVIWAITIPAYGMAGALILNAVLSIYLAFKFSSKETD